MYVAVGTRRMSKCAVELSLSDLFPGAFGMLLCAAHTGGEILEAIHVQSSAPVTGR